MPIHVHTIIPNYAELFNRMYRLHIQKHKGQYQSIHKAFNQFYFDHRRCRLT